MRKKILVSAKRLLAGLLAVGMAFGTVGEVPGDTAYAAASEDGLAYFVDCGDFDPGTVPENRKLGSSQSVTDKIYGLDDAAGKSWGVVVSDSDKDIGRPAEAKTESKAAYTTYQWAKEAQGADSLSEKDTFRYAHGQDTAGINPRYVKYRFEVEPGTYFITVGMGNSWNNAGNPDVYAGTAGEKDADVKLNAEAMNIPANGYKEAAGEIQVESEGSLYVYALSGDATIQMNCIQIVKLPENVVTELKIMGEPDKKEYFVGETLDISGIEIQAVYKNGDTKKIESDLCEVSGFDSGRAGQQTVTVSYTEGVTVQAFFTVEVKKIPISVSEDPNLMYFVDCGDFDPETTSEGDAVGICQSVTDRIYGEDRNGKSWGVVVSDTDQAIAIPQSAKEGSNAAYTAYQWAHERQTKDLPKEESFRYAHDQGVAGISPRYVRYRFDVDAGEYQVTVGMGNSWNNAGNPDVYAGISGEKESDARLNKEAMDIPENGHKEAVGIIKIETNGSLYVYALSSEDTIQMNYIRIIKMPENSIEKLEITKMPLKTEYIMGEELDVSGMTLQAVYQDGSKKEVPVHGCEVRGFDSSRAGKQTITVKYTESLSVEAVFEITVKKPPITVSDDPNLMYFVDCGDFDPETVSQGDAVGRNQSVTDKVYGPDQNGKSWGVVTSDDGDEVIAIPEAAAEKGSNAAYTAYQWAHERQTKDLPKEESFRYAHDQGVAGISPRYIKYCFDVDAGEYQITVGMGNSWNNAGNPDVYAGMSGEKETDARLNAEALNIPFNGNKEASGTVKIEADGSLYVYALSEDDTIQMNYIQIKKVPQNALASLRIVQEPEKKVYEIGDELDTAGLSLEAVYEDGTVKAVAAENCKITGFDSSRAGTKNITISYQEVLTVEAVFTVTVKKPAISVSQDPNLMYFVDCGDFDPETTSHGDAVSSRQSVTDRIYGEDRSGKKWGVVTSDNGDEAIPVPEAAAKNGSNAVYTAYQWAHERQTDDTPKEESFRYAHGQDQAGIGTRYVRYRFELEPGRYLVTVGVGNSWGNSGNPDIYAGMTGNPKKDAKLNSDVLAVPFGQTTEVQGKAAVAEGKNILEVYVLSEEETVQVNYIRIEKAAGGQDETTLKKLRIVPPQKVIYQLLETQEMDTEGMLVYAVYSDGYEKILSIGEYKISGFDTSEVGTRIITVKYTEGDISVQALFEIEVVSEDTPIVPEAVLSGLEIVRMPDKMEYQLNEVQEIDVKGMEIEACYSDGARKEICPGMCTISGFDCSKEGEQEVSVVYEENGRTAGTSFCVKVIKEAEAPITYRVIYHENKGGRVSGMPSDPKSYQKGQKATVKGTPVSASKFFAGWNTKADGTGKSYAAGKTITVQGTIHLYARWKTSYTASNKLKYKVTGKKTIECTGTFNKKATSIKVPDSIKYYGITYKVTSIGAKAFAKNQKIKKAAVGNNVKSIKARAFEKCSSLKSITVGSGLAEIGKYAFSGEKKGCVLIINSKKLKTVKSAINHKTKNMVIKAPKSKLKAYKKIFAKKAKKVKVIAK